ncbi:MAG TPA: hypothetical protein VJA23_04080 [Candidatus Nanoarchaeia archaeon]|nr:hypothetical protein [Candidatus Nanoarchaeia archaeon]
MTKEQLVNDQISAMYGWAIKAKQNADSGKYTDAEAFLRNINVQGRRLEWRGWRWRLRSSPEVDEVKKIKMRISEVRAAALLALFYIEHLEKLAKKEGKKPEEIVAINKKKKDYQKETIKNLTILIHVLKKLFAARSEKTDSLDLLTELVLAKFKKLAQEEYGHTHPQYDFVRLWLASNEIEYLPNGIPYKIVDDMAVHYWSGTFVLDFGYGKLNQPLILVSSKLSPAERKSVAMHEFVEWSQCRANPYDTASHFEAIKKQNPTLFKSVAKKNEETRRDRSRGNYSNKPYAGYNESLAKAIAGKKRKKSLISKLFKKLSR